MKNTEGQAVRSIPMKEYLCPVPSSLDLEKVFKKITDTFVQALGYNTAIIFMLNQGTNRIESKSLTTKHPLFHQVNKILGISLENFSFPFDSTLCPGIKICKERKTIVSKSLDAIAHPLISKRSCTLIQKIAKTKNYILFPFVIDGKVLGGIVLTTSDEQVTEKELRVIEGFADIAVLAIQNAELHKEVKTAKDELEKSEILFRSIVENAHTGIFLVDGSYKFAYVNDELSRILGYPPEEIMGQDFRKFLDEESRQLVAERYLKRRSGEDVPSRYEFNIVRKDGKKRRVEIAAALVKDRSSNVSTIAQILDITERKEAEEALRRSEGKYRNLIEMSPDVILTLDMEGRITSCNNFMLKATGYSEKEIIGKHFKDLPIVSRKDVPHYLKMVSLVAEGKLANPFEVRWIHKDGTQYFAEIRMAYIKENGQNVGFQIVARDITGRKRGEAKIKAALEEKEVLLKEIHHRVKNNMQIISSLLRLQSRQIQDKEIRKLFDISQNRISSMALIHESLYQSEDFAHINFSRYVERLSSRLFSLYSDGSGRVRLKLDVKDVFIDINKAIPCGLLINELVSNALIHGFPDGKEGLVEVKMTSNGGKGNILVVRDTGKGIPKDLNFKEPDTLGLQLVSDLVKQLKGTLHLDRNSGTEFRIVF